MFWVAGAAHSLKVEKILFQGQSDYQNVMVFKVFKNVLISNKPPPGPRYKCDYLEQSFVPKFSLAVAAVINLREGACFGWSNSINRERWMCISRNDCASSSLLYSKPKEGQFDEFRPKLGVVLEFLVPFSFYSILYMRSNLQWQWAIGNKRSTKSLWLHKDHVFMSSGWSTWFCTG